jgi:hypothetical protein
MYVSYLNRRNCLQFRKDKERLPLTDVRKIGRSGSVHIRRFLVILRLTFEAWCTSREDETCGGKQIKNTKYGLSTRQTVELIH